MHILGNIRGGEVDEDAVGVVKVGSVDGEVFAFQQAVDLLFNEIVPQEDVQEVTRRFRGFLVLFPGFLRSFLLLLWLLAPLGS